MTSVSSAEPNGQPSRRIYSSLVPYIAPPIAASSAVTLVFYGFIAKSAQQLGNPIPRMGMKTALLEGCKAAPTIGVIIGTQMGAQKVAETALTPLMKRSGEIPSFAPMFVSSMIVGALSAPALAVFNGQSMGQTVGKSLKLLNAKQTCAIVARETSFLFSIRVSEPVSEFMKHSCGDNKAVELGSTFATGAIGSLIGHPADTALTLWQKGRKVENFRQMMRGGPMKAATVGVFSIFYKMAKECIESTSK